MSQGIEQNEGHKQPKDQQWENVLAFSGLLQGGASFEDAMTRAGLDATSNEALLDMVAITGYLSGTRKIPNEMYDAACKLVPRELMNDRRFQNAASLGMSPDHQDWRAFNYFRNERLGSST